MALVACSACGDDARRKGGPPDAARPSLLLVVMDTTRRDAVSAYGAVDATTPFLDSLAREGLRYDWALAPSPWTLPSHATLFTALGPERHGVGLSGRMVLGARHPTLAERLAQAGYDTVGLSENPIVGAPVGLARGFAHFGGESDAVAARAESAETVFDVVLGAKGWADSRPARRPFFVFVNLFDPHDPYLLRDEAPFLPPGADLERARRMGAGDGLRGIAEAMGICDRLPPQEDLAILRGLYLGEVARADEKLRRIHQVLAEEAGGRLVTVVTADHGEHLGEHRLLGHEFSLHAELLRVPLVVHGLDGVAPAVIETPVELADVAPSVLGWLGVEPPADWPARVLPVRPGGAEANATELPPHFAYYTDAPLVAPEGMRVHDPEQVGRRRAGCEPSDRVFGDILALVRFPFKLIRYEHEPPQLYDLRWDERELSDVARHEPERVASMSRELEAWTGRAAETLEASSPEPLPEQTVESLRALGYLE